MNNRPQRGSPFAIQCKSYQEACQILCGKHDSTKWSLQTSNSCYVYICRYKDLAPHIAQIPDTYNPRNTSSRGNNVESFLFTLSQETVNRFLPPIIIDMSYMYWLIITVCPERLGWLWRRLKYSYTLEHAFHHFLCSGQNCCFSCMETPQQSTLSHHKVEAMKPQAGKRKGRPKVL